MPPARLPPVPDLPEAPPSARHPAARADARHRDAPGDLTAVIEPAREPPKAAPTQVRPTAAAEVAFAATGIAITAVLIAAALAVYIRRRVRRRRDDPTLVLQHSTPSMIPSPGEIWQHLRSFASSRRGGASTEGLEASEASDGDAVAPVDTPISPANEAASSHDGRTPRSTPCEHDRASGLGGAESVDGTLRAPQHAQHGADEADGVTAMVWLPCVCTGDDAFAANDPPREAALSASQKILEDWGIESAICDETHPCKGDDGCAGEPHTRIHVHVRCLDDTPQPALTSPPGSTLSSPPGSSGRATPAQHTPRRHDSTSTDSATDGSMQYLQLASLPASHTSAATTARSSCEIIPLPRPSLQRPLTTMHAASAGAAEDIAPRRWAPRGQDAGGAAARSSSSGAGSSLSSWTGSTVTSRQASATHVSGAEDADVSGAPSVTSLHPLDMLRMAAARVATGVLEPQVTEPGATPEGVALPTDGEEAAAACAAARSMTGSPVLMLPPQHGTHLGHGTRTCMPAACSLELLRKAGHSASSGSSVSSGSSSSGNTATDSEHEASSG